MKTAATDVTSTSSVKAVPTGMRTVTPHLICANAGDAIEFYKKAFGAVELSRMPAPDGKLAHGSFRIGDSIIMINEERPDWGVFGPKTLKGSPVVIHLYVDDVDAVFAQAVRAVLRQDPDVILIGEMRDSETMSAALTAAETGHLVLSSLHTNDAAQTISRILDTFPSGDQSQIRQQLSLALLAVISQQLLPAQDGGVRYPAAEILVANHATRNLIRRGDDHQLRGHIETGRADGMLTMEQSLVELVQARRISRETALAHCYHPDDLRRYLGS